MTLLTHKFIGQEEYQKLGKVFCKSARYWMPDCEIIVKQTRHPKIPKKHRKEPVQHHIETSIAFIDLARHVIELNKPLAVCDIDLMFIKSIESIWNYKFDIAFTIRDYRAPLNTGIWFYSATERAKDFVAAWIQNTKHLLNEYLAGKKKVMGVYAGIDQASLNLTLRKRDPAYALSIPCVEWNCTQSELPYVSSVTKVIHIKSRLRKIVMKDDPVPFEDIEENMRPFVALWQKYYNEDI